MPRVPTISAEPVMCTGSACSSNGRSSRRDLGQEALDADPLPLVDGDPGGDRGEHVLHRVAHGGRP